MIGGEPYTLGLFDTAGMVLSLYIPVGYCLYFTRNKIMEVKNMIDKGNLSELTEIE